MAGTSDGSGLNVSVQVSDSTGVFSRAGRIGECGVYALSPTIVRAYILLLLFCMVLPPLSVDLFSAVIRVDLHFNQPVDLGGLWLCVGGGFHSVPLSTYELGQPPMGRFNMCVFPLVFLWLSRLARLSVSREGWTTRLGQPPFGIRH